MDRTPACLAQRLLLGPLRPTEPFVSVSAVMRPPHLRTLEDTVGQVQRPPLPFKALLMLGARSIRVDGSSLE